MHKLVNIPNQDEGRRSSINSANNTTNNVNVNINSNSTKSDKSWIMQIPRDDEDRITSPKMGSKTKTTGKKNGVSGGGGETNNKDIRSQLVLSSLLATLIPILFPLIHIVAFYILWSDLAYPVDQKRCTCSCWDTIFKGPYETGIAKYKHVYFNSTWNVFKMWSITVVGVIILYECFKAIFRLILLGKLRLTMAILFFSSLHSHYYAYWAHWNYWNDDFYELWYHQVVFTVTEFLSSALVINYLDKRKPIQPLPLIIVANISLFHILSSGWDQFFFTVIQQKGHLHQVLRDILLMSTDIVHTAIAAYELKKYARQKGQTFSTLLLQKRHAVSIFCTTSFMYLMVIFFP